MSISEAYLSQVELIRDEIDRLITILTGGRIPSNVRSIIKSVVISYLEYIIFEYVKYKGKGFPDDVSIGLAIVRDKQFIQQLLVNYPEITRILKKTLEFTKDLLRGIQPTSKGITVELSKLPFSPESLSKSSSLGLSNVLKEGSKGEVKSESSKSKVEGGSLKTKLSTIKGSKLKDFELDFKSVS